MATDQSPPRTRLIVTLTIVTVVSLGALKPIFDSYYTDMFEAEAKAKLASPDELRKQHEEEQQKLTGGPLTIDKAMGELAHGREGSALIAPLQSNDTAPLLGWSRLVPDGGVAPKFEAPPSTGMTGTTGMTGMTGMMPAPMPASDASAPTAATGDASTATTTTTTVTTTTTTTTPAPSPQTPKPAGDAAP